MSSSIRRTNAPSDSTPASEEGSVDATNHLREGPHSVWLWCSGWVSQRLLSSSEKADSAWYTLR
jgi:hypothetical protein